MDDRRALMAAIIANPDEDTPRLALADWLQEHGDKHDQARAEFIRLQIQAALMPKGAKRKKLEANALTLEKRHREAWLAPLLAVGGADTSSFEHTATGSGFSRGLLHYLFFSPGDFFLKAVHAALPDAFATVGVEELLFYSRTKRIADLAASPVIRWVCRLQYPGADDAALAEFARAPNFAHLRTLDFCETRASDAGLRTFATTSGTTRLRELEFTTQGGLDNIRGKITSAGILALLHSDRLPLLDSLDIDGAPGAKFGLATLLANPELKRLGTFRFGNPVMLADIVACPHFTNLHTLELSQPTMTDADADALLASPTFSKLRVMRLGLTTRLAPATIRKLKARFGDGLRCY